MRIMLDSNVLISIGLFRSIPSEEFIKSLKGHKLVLTNLIIDETLGVVRRKFPRFEKAFGQFLSELSYDYSFIGLDTYIDYGIRDKSDNKILHSAYHCSVDILITGDEDFFEKEYECLEILKPSEFVKKYYSSKPN